MFKPIRKNMSKLSTLFHGQTVRLRDFSLDGKELGLKFQI